MFALIRPALTLFVLLTILTGGIYPALVTVVAKLAFARQAEGSLIMHDGKALGSELIAQPFSGNQYFWPRPSAANYDGAAASGSNLAPTNPALASAVADRIQALRASGIDIATIPVDLITASASGLDPHISIEAAQCQVARIAAVRKISTSTINDLLEQCTENRTLGLLGEPRVNVLMLNLELDHLITPPVDRDDKVVGWRGRAFLPESIHQ